MIRFNSRTPEWAWLSNFYDSPIVDIFGTIWPTAEHLYQACKCFDGRDRETVRKMPSPELARQTGKRIMKRRSWDDARIPTMREVLRMKFTQHHDLAKKLVETDNEVLEHLSPWDKFWGVTDRGEGENQMGILLMELRPQIAVFPPVHEQLP